MTKHANQVVPLRSAPAHARSTVAEYLETWLWGKQGLRATTHAAYESHVRRYLVPALGHLPLAELRPEHIEQMLRELAKPVSCSGVESHRGRAGLSISTLHRVHATLMSALNTAVRRGLLDRNPAATVELPRVPRERYATWSSEELRVFLTAINDHRLHLLFVMLGILGLRRGEAVALPWNRVDLNRGCVRIDRAAVRLAGRTVLGPPKSPSSLRTLAMDDETARRLTWHAARQRLEVLQANGTKSQPDLVFTTMTGEMLDPTWVSREFDRLIARHGLRRIRLHDLRHTSASLGLETGETLIEVSRRLGHSSITVTADIYSQVSPMVARESVERLANTVYRTGGPR